MSQGKYNFKFVNDQLILFLKDHYQLNEPNRTSYYDIFCGSFSVKKPFIPKSSSENRRVFGFFNADITIYAIPTSNIPFGIVGESIGQTEYCLPNGRINTIAHERIRTIYNNTCNVYLAQKVLIQLFPLYLHLKNFLNIPQVYSFFCGEKQFENTIECVLEKIKEHLHLQNYVKFSAANNRNTIHTDLVVYKIEFPEDSNSILRDLLLHGDSSA